MTEFNIHFGFPRSNTCERCDSLKLRIEAATEEDRQSLEKELKSHLELAEEGYKCLHKDCEICQESWSKNQ